MELSPDILQLGLGGALTVSVLWLVLEMIKVFFPKKKDDKMDELINEIKMLGENHLHHMEKAIVEGNQILIKQHEKQIDQHETMNGLLSEIKGSLK